MSKTVIAVFSSSGSTFLKPDEKLETVQDKKNIKNVLNLRDLNVSIELVEMKKEIAPHHKKLKTKQNKPVWKKAEKEATA